MDCQDNNEPYVNKAVYDYAFVEFNDRTRGISSSSNNT